MEQLHAHEVLHMMEGNSYTELSLREAIIQKFGEQQRFFTCSANNMDVDTLIERKIYTRQWWIYSGHD
mgnify:CR=1 FL=1